MRNKLTGKKKLVIVESPTKAKTISKLLGKAYTSIATVGHFRDLSKKNFGIEINEISNGKADEKGLKYEFIPNYEVSRSKEVQKVKKELKEGKKNASEIYIATDPDREGEAIGWHIADFLDLNQKETNRIVFNEFTKKAVLDSLDNPRKLDSDLFNSQQARRLLDRLYGFQVSPVLWKKVKGKTSAGRVQSPVLQFVIEREEEIDKFTPEDFWNISSNLKYKNNNLISFLNDPKASKLARYRIFDKSKTDKIVKILSTTPGKVKDIKTSQSYRSPRPPFITSSLQQEASQKLGMSPDVTMSFAQQLFEGLELDGLGSVGLITYMRTDSFSVSETAMNTLRSYIKNKYGDEYLPGKPNTYKNKSRSQEAHECIRPTDVEMSPDKLKKLIPDKLERKDSLLRLYDIIWKRFVSSQMEKAKYDVNRVIIECEKKYLDEDLVFRIENWKVKFAGYSILYGDDREKSDDESEGSHDFAIGEKVSFENVESKYDQTKPPPRYNEAMLVRKMEQEGIGRPSTYANTIKTNLKLYLEKKESRLWPTKLGKAISKFLKSNFSTEVSPSYTTEMEEKLDLIATGDMNWQLLLNDLYIKLDTSIKNALEQERVPREEVEEYSDEHCELCESPMIIRASRANGTKFLGCSGFPKCKNMKQIIVETSSKCPECDKGNLRQLQGSRGSVYYGCSAYPDCKFNSRYQPIDEACQNIDCNKKPPTQFLVRGNKMHCVLCKNYSDLPEKIKSN